MTETPAPAAQLSDNDARMYATIAHAGNILFPAVAPLIMWLIGKDKSTFVDTEGKEALNFGIVLAIGYFVGSILTLILIGVVVIFAVWVVSIIFGIKGAMAANKGEAFRYPFNWRIIK